MPPLFLAAVATCGTKLPPTDESTTQCAGSKWNLLKK